MELPAALPRWTMSERGDPLTVTLDHAPSRSQLAWLVALGHSGHQIRWNGTMPPVAITAEQVADPRGGELLALAAPGGSTALLRDAVGPIDSLTTGANGAQLIVPRDAITDPGRDSLRAIIGGGDTTGARQPSPATVRPLFVVGAAGWEAKFTVAALEERGWRVDARLMVAPGVFVGSAPASLDTATVAAVIAFDTTVASLGSAISQFVRDGGGLVLAGNAANARNVSALAPGRPGVRVPAVTVVADTLGIASAGWLPIVQLTPDAQVVQRRGRDAAIAARRVGAGRVLQVGYDETWRWRMAGGPGSAARHRAWWAGIVSTVAYAPGGSDSTSVTSPFLAAPRADVTQALGEPRASPASMRGWSPDPRWLLAAIFLLLLVEWSSRRTRGLR